MNKLRKYLIDLWLSFRSRVHSVHWCQLMRPRPQRLPCWPRRQRSWWSEACRPMFRRRGCPKRTRLPQGRYAVIPIFRLLQNKCQENTIRSKVVGRSCENLMHTQSENKATPLDNTQQPSKCAYVIPSEVKKAATHLLYYGSCSLECDSTFPSMGISGRGFVSECFRSWRNVQRSHHHHKLLSHSYGRR